LTPWHFIKKYPSATLKFAFYTFLTSDKSKARKQKKLDICKNHCQIANLSSLIVVPEEISAGLRCLWHEMKKRKKKKKKEGERSLVLGVALI